MLTADSLRLSSDERRAMRRAGLVAADLAHLEPLELVAATDEAIGEDRANALIGRAELLALGVHAGALAEVGVVCRRDLVGRTPESLWIQVVEETARTHPHYYDLFCHAVHVATAAPATDADADALRTLAGWRRRRERSGFDPMTLVWRHRHGDDTPFPRSTSRRLRLPTIGVSAPVCEGAVDPHGDLVTPLGQKDVVVPDGSPARLVLGHWMWSGGHGAFVRLEDLAVGDGVQLGRDWFAVRRVEKVAVGVAGDDRLGAVVDPAGRWLVLATAVHRRVGVIGTAEMLPPVERGSLRVVVRAEPVDAADAVDTAARPKRHIGGAY